MYVFDLSVGPSVDQSARQSVSPSVTIVSRSCFFFSFFFFFFLSAQLAPLKPLNKISWNFVLLKNMLCIFAYSQDILIYFLSERTWILMGKNITLIHASCVHEFLIFKWQRSYLELFFFMGGGVQWMSKYFTNMTIINRLCVSALLSNVTLECGACELTHSSFQLLLSPLGNQHFYPFSRIMYHRVRCANLSWLKLDHWFQRSQRCIFNYVVLYVVTILLCFLSSCCEVLWSFI